MPVHRTWALAGALVIGCLIASPAWGADVCGKPGYSYAGLVASDRVHGISAYISAPSTPTVQSGDVAGWIGVGRARVDGRRGSIRAGVVSIAGAQPQLFFDFRSTTTGQWRRFLGPVVAPGAAHRVGIKQIRLHPRYWRVWMDGHVVSNRFRLPLQLRGKGALATGESWDGGTPTCNQFAFHFGEVRVRQDGRWRRLIARPVLQDPGYAVVRQPSSAFVAMNAPDGSDFVGDWETGDSSQWSGNHWNQSAPLSDQFQVVTDPVRQGNFAAKFIVRPGDRFGTTSGERSEVLWTGSDEAEGQDYWYSWSTLFPTDWSAPRNWGIFLQWHAFNWTTPAVAFNARDNSVVINVDGGPLNAAGTTGSVRNVFPLLSTLNKGLWNDFIAHIKWSSGNDGAITVWHRVDGEDAYTKVLDVSGFPTLQSQDGVTAKNYVKMGLYRDADTKTDVIYHDGFHRWSSPDPPPEVVGTA